MGCAGKEDHFVEHLEHMCHTGSIVVLVLFMVEILLKMWAIPDWWQYPLHKLDLFVVSLSLFFDTVVVWAIEAMATNKSDSVVKADIDMVVVVLLLARFWRIVRIVY